MTGGPSLRNLEKFYSIVWLESLRNCEDSPCDQQSIRRGEHNGPCVLSRPTTQVQLDEPSKVRKPWGVPSQPEASKDYGRSVVPEAVGVHETEAAPVVGKLRVIQVLPTAPPVVDTAIEGFKVLVRKRIRGWRIRSSNIRLQEFLSGDGSQFHHRIMRLEPPIGGSGTSHSGGPIHAIQSFNTPHAPCAGVSAMSAEGGCGTLGNQGIWRDGVGWLQWILASSGGPAGA